MSLLGRANGDGHWTSLDSDLPDSAGSARFISEASAPSRRPEAVEVTREPPGPAAAPGGSLVAKRSADHE